MEKEVLQRDLKSIEDSRGEEVLNLAVARGYLTKLFDNTRIVRYALLIRVAGIRGLSRPRRFDKRPKPRAGVAGCKLRSLPSRVCQESVDTGGAAQCTMAAC
jgi:hypothetical protein